MRIGVARGIRSTSRPPRRRRLSVETSMIIAGVDRLAERSPLPRALRAAEADRGPAVALEYRKSPAHHGRSRWLPAGVPFAAADCRVVGGVPDMSPRTTNQSARELVYRKPTGPEDHAALGRKS